MYYFKKIISYFDYYEFGEKKKSCGYSKIVVKDREVTAEIQIKGLGVRENCVCDVYAAGEGNKRLGKFALVQGTGCYKACFDGADMDGNKLSVFEVTGLRIVLDENKYCETAWEWGKLPEEQQKEADFAEERDAYEEAIGAYAEEEPAVREIWRKELPEEQILSKEILPAREAVSEETVLTEKGAPIDCEEEIECKKETDKEEHREESAGESTELFLHKAQIPEQTGEKRMGNGTKGLVFQETLHEDKWEQLCSVYPVCHPFQDGEDYISIAPKDFIILRKEYQNLVGNSFLLHSFYNYHHIILGKTGNDDMYYMGVPGSYLDREKRVAVMFGFEGFAQSVRGNAEKTVERAGKPAVAAGAFGYYMRKVEI